jgi:hypothetical protein
MHDIAILRVTTGNIGYDLAEGCWKEPFIKVRDCGMDIFFGGGYSAPGISEVFGHLLLEDKILATLQGL